MDGAIFTTTHGLNMNRISRGDVIFSNAKGRSQSYGGPQQPLTVGNTSLE